MEQTLDAIMSGITAGLTGDAKQDIAYLMQQGERYRGHPLQTEIARACGRLIYALLPEEARQAYAAAAAKDDEPVKAALRETYLLIRNREYGRALETVGALIEKVEAANRYADDSASVYFVFNEPFEELLYRQRKHPEKKIRRANIPYPEIYLLQGSILMELRRPAQARAALQKALRWNPMDFNIMAEYVETFKQEGDMDAFFAGSKELLELAFRPKQLARCQRNLGYFFIEKKQYAPARACFMYSLVYEPSSAMAKNELRYIDSLTQARDPIPDAEEIDRLVRRSGLQLRGAPDVLALADHFARLYAADSDKNSARYFLTIAYELTGDPEYKRLLDAAARAD